MASKRKPGKRQERQGRQCAALPCMRHDGELRVLLVTSRETRRWVLPKGWMEKRLAPHALAAKEAFEEAGILGRVERRPLGRYDYLKRDVGGADTPCTVRVFRMRVDRLLDEWPERHERERRWFGLAEAAMAVDESGLAALLLEAALSGAPADAPGVPPDASADGDPLVERRGRRPHRIPDAGSDSSGVG